MAIFEEMLSNATGWKILQLLQVAIQGKLKLNMQIKLETNKNQYKQKFEFSILLSL